MTRHFGKVLKMALAYDWLPESEDYKMDLMEIYTQLQWSLLVKTGLSSKEEPMTSVFDIFKFDDKDPKKILVEGELVLTFVTNYFL